MISFFDTLLSFCFFCQSTLSSLNLDECFEKKYTGKEVSEMLRKRKERSPFTIVVIGCLMNSWSFTVADAFVDEMLPPPSRANNLTFFKADIQNPQSWAEVKDYVRIHGKFNFSICSHILEDLALPWHTLRLLEDISHDGYIATPTKYRELCCTESPIFQQSYFSPTHSSICNLTALHSRSGNFHHRWIFSIRDRLLWLVPKLPPIIELVANELASCDERILELSFLWHKHIPYKIVNNNFRGPNLKAGDFYKNLLLNDDLDKKYSVQIKGRNIVTFNTMTIFDSVSDF